MCIKFISSAITAYSRRNYSTTKTARKIYESFKYKKINKPKKPRISLTDEQKLVLDRVTCGDSVFITGSAGTGKTFLLKHIIKSLKKTHGKSSVFVTASTGVAACALYGQTLHSFAGIGVATLDRRNLLERVYDDKRACRRWNKAKALVIDEISMVDAILFENLECIARETRGSNKTWGGIQLIVSGDFLQLPPVLDKNSPSDKAFAFEADCWDSSFDIQVELTKAFRQSDSRLIKLLQGIRRGETDPQDLKFLEQSYSIAEPDPSAVRLFPRIKDVEELNKQKMEELTEEVIIYEADDHGKYPWLRQLKLGIAPDELVLCKGARVMLIKNLNPWCRLVNGSTGVVTGFNKSDKDVTYLTPYNLLPVVKFDSGREMMVEPETWKVTEGDKVVAWRRQVPLILAWALSVHKCQGMTIPHLHTDLSKAFGYGMVYVALSRVQSIDGLHLSGFCPSKIKAHPKVLQFYKSFACEQDGEGKDYDDAEKKKDSSSDLLAISVAHKISSGGSKFHFSLKEFLLSRHPGK